MNNVTLIGNLTRNPELRYATTGTAIGRFTLALNRPKKDGQDQQADFINIVTFGKLAENCGNYLAKGRKVGVEGRIQSGSYQDKEGRTIYTVDVLAHNVEFLSPMQNNSQSSSQDYSGIEGFQPTDSDDSIPF